MLLSFCLLSVEALSGFHRTAVLPPQRGVWGVVVARSVEGGGRPVHGRWKVRWKVGKLFPLFLFRTIIFGRKNEPLALP